MNLKTALLRGRRFRTLAAMAEFLVFLRGINVGGKSLIKMADLKAELEADGFENVHTYIQSGNVFVTTRERKAEVVAAAVSNTIKRSHDLDVRAVAFTKSQWTKVVQSAPDWWGTGDGWKHDLFILIPPFSMKRVVNDIGEPKEDIELLESGQGVVYASLHVKSYGRTRISKLPGTPVYKQITVRNYNTSTKLLALFS
jgi:uncharacterized protein (DUF1697 family)